MTRSSLSSPESLSISYLQREPCGISMIALTTRGAFLPTGTPCQGWETVIIMGAFESEITNLKENWRIGKLSHDGCPEHGGQQAEDDTSRDIQQEITVIAFPYQSEG